VVSTPPQRRRLARCDFAATPDVPWSRKHPVGPSLSVSGQTDERSPIRP
jgi:hypothetical protein